VFSFIPWAKVFGFLAVVGTIGGLYYYNQSIVWERDNLKTAVDTLNLRLGMQKEYTGIAIESSQKWQKAFKDLQATHEKLVTVQEEANTHNRRLTDVLSRHNLEALSLAKPGLIENRINSGTIDSLRLLRDETRDSNGAR
jgi:hypothetical protein